MTRARLHWFWRALIAVIVGFGLSIVINVAVARALSPAAFGATPLLIALGVVRLTIPVIVYGLLTRWYGPNAALERETRCRSCGYILRGISEPRCSECGERI